MPLQALNQLTPPRPDAPLTEKLKRARAVLLGLLRLVGPQRAAVAFTGGKDSSIALALWRETLGGHGPLRAVSVDTGLKFPEVTAFRDRLCAQWSVDLHVSRPRLDVSSYPVAADKLACCRDLKIEPLGRALRETGTLAIITGLRRDEHPSRAERPYAELKPATDLCPEHWQVNAILDWTEMDVWAQLTGEGLPYCGLYHQGYRSLGCMPCTRAAGLDEAERAGRDPDKERQLETLKALGYF